MNQQSFVGSAMNKIMEMHSVRSSSQQTRKTCSGVVGETLNEIAKDKPFVFRSPIWVQTTNHLWCWQMCRAWYLLVKENKPTVVYHICSHLFQWTQILYHSVHIRQCTEWHRTYVHLKNVVKHDNRTYMYVLSFPHLSGVPPQRNLTFQHAFTFCWEKTHHLYPAKFIGGTTVKRQTMSTRIHTIRLFRTEDVNKPYVLSELDFQQDRWGTWEPYFWDALDKGNKPCVLFAILLEQK